MSNPFVQGCGTALVTPFTPEGEVDFNAYASLVDRQVAAGIDFLVPLATTGETPTLSVEEKIKLMQITREHAPGIPLIVGCGSNSVPATLANMALLEPYGVDAWLVVVPFYNKPTQEGQYQYFKAVAAATDKPVVIYNVPGRTGANMSAATCTRLARDVKNIVAIKEASGKMEQVEEIILNAPEDFAILSGDDDMTLAMIEKGAHGVISVASNIAPALVTAMTSAALSGNSAEAHEIDARLQPLFKNCFIESNPIPVKAGMEHMGLMTAAVRLPLSEATPSTKQTMAQTVEALGL